MAKEKACFLLRILPFIDYVVSGDVYSDAYKVQNFLTLSIPEQYPYDGRVAN